MKTRLAKAMATRGDWRRGLSRKSHPGGRRFEYRLPPQRKGPLSGIFCSLSWRRNAPKPRRGQVFSQGRLASRADL